MSTHLITINDQGGHPHKMFRFRRKEGRSIGQSFKKKIE